MVRVCIFNIYLKVLGEVICRLGPVICSSFRALQNKSRNSTKNTYWLNTYPPHGKLQVINDGWMKAEQISKEKHITCWSEMNIVFILYSFLLWKLWSGLVRADVLIKTTDDGFNFVLSFLLLFRCCWSINQVLEDEISSLFSESLKYTNNYSNKSRKLRSRI